MDKFYVTYDQFLKPYDEIEKQAIAGKLVESLRERHPGLNDKELSILWDELRHDKERWYEFARRALK